MAIRTRYAQNLYREMPIRDDLRFDVRLLDQKHRYVIAYWVNTVAIPALQLILVLAVGERSLADRTSKNLEQVFVDHGSTILRRLRVEWTERLTD